MLSQPYAPIGASLFFLVPLFSLVFLVRRRAVMYSPVPALAVFALLSGVLAFVPSVHAQQIVRALLGAVLGASVLYLQVLLSSSLYALLPAVILLCATLLSFVTPLIPTYAFAAPTLSLVFTVSTLPFTILLFLSKPPTPPRPPMDDFALPLPSPTFSTTSFPSSETHCEKPPQDPYKPGGPLCPPRALLTHCSTVENPTSSWFSSHTDPESQVVPRPQSRFPLSSFLHYRFSPRRIVHVLLLATQLSSIISSAFEIPAVILSRLPRFISASPSPPLATAVVTADGRIRPTLVSAFWILQTLFTVFSLFFIVLAYYNYRHQDHDMSGTPPLPRCTPLDLNTRTPPRTCATSSSSSSPLTPTHKHKRALPSASSSFFSPRPKRTPLPLSLAATSTYTGDVMVLGSIHHKDDSSDEVEDGGGGVGVPELDSSPSSTSTSTSTSSMSPTPARLPIPPELRLSPSPARRATLVHPLPALVPSSSSSHSSSCTVHGPGSSHSGAYQANANANAYNEMYDTDTDMDVLDAMSRYEVSDIDFRDLRDPFASPLRSPTGCRGNGRVSCGGGYSRTPRSYHPHAHPHPSLHPYPYPREQIRPQQKERGGYTVHYSPPLPRTQSRMSAWGRLQLPLPIPMQMQVGCRGGGGGAKVRGKGKGKGKGKKDGGGRVGDGARKEKGREGDGEGEGEGEKDVDGQVEDDALLAERLLMQLGGGGGAGGGGVGVGAGGASGEKGVLES